VIPSPGFPASLAQSKTRIRAKVQVLRIRNEYPDPSGACVPRTTPLAFSFLFFFRRFYFTKRYGSGSRLLFGLSLMTRPWPETYLPLPLMTTYFRFTNNSMAASHSG
jgi:hypothetical protein